MINKWQCEQILLVQIGFIFLYHYDLSSFTVTWKHTKNKVSKDKIRKKDNKKIYTLNFKGYDIWCNQIVHQGDLGLHHIVHSSNFFLHIFSLQIFGTSKNTRDIQFKNLDFSYIFEVDIDERRIRFCGSRLPIENDYIISRRRIK